MYSVCVSPPLAAIELLNYAPRDDDDDDGHNANFMFKNSKLLTCLQTHIREMAKCFGTCTRSHQQSITNIKYRAKTFKRTVDFVDVCVCVFRRFCVYQLFSLIEMHPAIGDPFCCHITNY